MYYKSLVRIPELAINPLGDRIVHAFFYESKSQGEEKVDFKVNCATISAGCLTWGGEIMRELGTRGNSDKEIKTTFPSAVKELCWVRVTRWLQGTSTQHSSSPSNVENISWLTKTALFNLPLTDSKASLSANFGHDLVICCPLGNTATWMSMLR